MQCKKPRQTLTFCIDMWYDEYRSGPLKYVQIFDDLQI